MTIGQLIKQELKNQNMRQSFLANATGISKNTISSICSDKHRPYDDTIDKICKVLKVKLSFYFEPIES
jgi:transcriptional regulator with XRE-family HTH domain